MLHGWHKGIVATRGFGYDTLRPEETTTRDASTPGESHAFTISVSCPQPFDVSHAADGSRLPDAGTSPAGSTGTDEARGLARRRRVSGKAPQTDALRHQRVQP